MKHQDDRHTWWVRGFLYMFVFSSIAFCLPAYSIAGQDTPKSLETVRGSGCYKFGDEETPAKARRGAMAIAQEEAVRKHHVAAKRGRRL